jgi:hypothetical protein
MENFKLVVWSDCRGILNIEKEVMLKFDNGKEVYDYIVNNMEDIDEDFLYVEGDVNNDIFNVGIGEERNCMVFRNFEEEVDIDLIMNNL